MRNYYNYFSSNNDVSFRDELIKITNYIYFIKGETLWILILLIFWKSWKQKDYLNQKQGKLMKNLKNL